MLVRLFSALSLTALALVPVQAGPAVAADPASAIVESGDCLQHELAGNDDQYSPEIALPFGIDFYGQSFDRLWVNNNGNVTFDGPLATYTPFGLSGTGARIIAPFFADVDTRAGQSVTYGWGDTTYEGHRAFCANWINVGYYAQHTDKTNSFQLLIVEREDTGVPGDFDIVFNYERVAWETGDASGGAGGLGGDSARAGFSNGSGQEGTSYELAGSGVNGGLLDSNARTGLSRYMTASNLNNTTQVIPGRHVFPVRSGGAPRTGYVALGDAGQSGEGAGDYLAGTDTETNRCHRSAHAYPQRLLESGVVNLALDFGACSGARAADLDVSSSPTRAPWDDRVSQYSRLNGSTKLVTIGIGGDDLDLPGILRSCLTLGATGLFSAQDTCQRRFDQRLEDSWQALVGGGDVLRGVFREVRARAPYARVVVLGHPRFYVDGGQGSTSGGDSCGGLRLTDQIWVNAGIRRLDDRLREAARSLGLQYVDTYDAAQGHELCGPSPDHFLNGTEPTRPVASYHPNQLGHSVLAGAVAQALGALPPGELFNVRPGQSIDYRFAVDASGFDASTQWPGSDVVLSLTSPSGRVIHRGTVAGDVAHEVGPTFESYHVTSAEQGTWTATLYGARVAAGGEETRLDIHAARTENLAPRARSGQSLAGRTLSVDGRASSDPDGSIVRYLWEFGDGASASGATATHTYTEPGTYRVSLATQDDRGRWAVTTGAPVEISASTVPAYAFSGFFAPVDNLPVVNTTKAGSAVPVKFALAGVSGLGVLAPGSPSSTRVDCVSGATMNEIEQTVTAGSSSLQYDAPTGRYTYVWKTQAAWADTCRRFVLTLADGSTHPALFRFR